MRRVWLLTILAWVLVGCGGGKLPATSEKEKAALPEGHPPVEGGGPMAGLGDPGPTDGNALPLRLQGLSSVQEVEKGKVRLTRAPDRKAVDVASARTMRARIAGSVWATAILRPESLA